MDKPSKSMNKILKFLPRAAQAAVTFQNPPFSPGRQESRLRTHMQKGFSAPIVRMIPTEARSGKSKNLETTPEPTSPKVSCMGQIKHKKVSSVCKKKKEQTSGLPRGYKEKKPEAKIANKPKPELSSARGELKKKPSGRLRKIFSARRRSDASADRLETAPGAPDRAPTLTQMRRFASSRDTFANFDWTTAAQVAPDDDDDDDDYEDRGYSDGEDDEVRIPFSAPILRAGGGAGGMAVEPRKEINLWKRRTMAQPPPLRLDVIGAQ